MAGGCELGASTQWCMSDCIVNQERSARTHGGVLLDGGEEPGIQGERVDSPLS